MRNLLNKNKKGFTLMELLISISIFSVGIVAIYSIVPNIVSITSTNINNFTASQLAREGLEVVRNMRDSNWLNRDPWDQGLSDGDYLVEYDETSLIPFADQYLKRDSSGFYNYSSGEDTVYKRTVTISHIDADSIEVTVEVTWPEAAIFSAASNSFSAKEILYNWR